MKNIGLPSLNENGHNVGYNIICLDGFKTETTSTSLSAELSPLGTWVNIYSRVMANTKNLIGSSSSDIQRHVVQKFNNLGAKILMNAFSYEQPISTKAANASIMADRIASFVESYNFDGVSIDFEDFHAVKAQSASVWLTTLLKNLRSLIPSNKIIALQIHPTLLKEISLFRSSLVNSYVDIFVLKYYNLVQNDYDSY
jgi:chitinase